MAMTGDLVQAMVDRESANCESLRKVVATAFDWGLNCCSSLNAPK
jgi:hypothetical protein